MLHFIQQNLPQELKITLINVSMPTYTPKYIQQINIFSDTMEAGPLEIIAGDSAKI